MATTRIIPMHLNKGKTLAQCLADRTEYGMNPDKTEGGTLISAFACEPETAVSEFVLSKREYRELTGRVQESDVIAYQVRQSFKPGEVTPEEAKTLIQKTDKRRAAYCEYYASKKWGAVDAYDFCLNSSALGLGGTVELIQTIVAHKEHPIPSPTEQDPTQQN